MAVPLFALFGAALAHDAPASTGSSTDAREQTPVASAGLRIYRDPASGEWLETPPPDAEGRSVAPQLDLPRPDYRRMTVEMMPDGSTVLHTNGQIRMATMVRRRADGSFEEYCAPIAAPAAVDTQKREPAQ
jgi:hypothetical protein